jgi:hypothetical protein
MRTLPQNVFLVLATSAILAGFIAFPKESEDAMAQLISATQWAVTTVTSYSHVQNPDKRQKPFLQVAI